MSTVAETLGLAVQHHQAGNMAQAAEFYRQVLQADPRHADAHHLLGVLALQEGRHEAGVAHIQNALQTRPSIAAFHGNLAYGLNALGRLDEAANEYEQALHLQPDNSEYYNNLGTIYFQQGKTDQAAVCYRRALDLNADYAHAIHNLGLVLDRQERLDEAAECFRQALQLDPGYASAHSNLGNVLFKQRKLDEALMSLERALSLNPDIAEAHVIRSLVWLTQGDFERGWPEYEWRWNQPANTRRQFEQSIWDGSTLQGTTVLLYAEQGLGDTLQFIRYVPLIKKLGASIIVECQPPLLRLLDCVPEIDQLCAHGSELPPFDVQAPLLSLPRILRTNLASVPATIPYLHANSQLVDYWKRELQSLRGLTIGIAWQGRPTNPSHQRTIPLTQFARLAALEGVQLVSLQKGPGTEQLETLSDQSWVLDLGSRLDEESGAFIDTAAVMRNLDLVICSDTAPAHLAGALGVPVWVALPWASDWRWLLQREDSPWYPTMRLFRQTRCGQWEDVFERITQEVRKLLLGRTA